MARRRNPQLLTFCVYIAFVAGMHLQCRAGRILGNDKSLSELAQHTSANGSNTKFMVEKTPGLEDADLKPRRMVSECTAATSGNPIDECWRCDPEWRQNRQGLANCAVGAGRHAIGGRNGRLYVVTDHNDVDPGNPVPGTLRFGVIQAEPLWIVFSQDMIIRLREELILNSFKTIDGRGFNVHIAGGAGLTLQSISNVILHGIHIHDIVSTGPATVRSSPTHAGGRGRTDGDAVNIYSSHDIWIDHCYFANGADGLVDVTMGSTGVTISNNYFTEHDKVILLGAHPKDEVDKGMRVTVAFNHFGHGLIERLPRYSSCETSLSINFPPNRINRSLLLVLIIITINYRGTFLEHPLPPSMSLPIACIAISSQFP